MTRGGVRKGAGRPKGQGKYKEPTTVMRVPLSLVGELKEYVALQGFKLPLYSGRVQAGYMTHAEENTEERIDLTEHLVRKPADTFLVRASGESMIDAGIQDGDLLIVDRSMPAANGKVVIAAVDGQLTVKFLIIKKGKPFLMPANAEFAPIPVDPENGVQIWGVVTNSIHAH